MIYFCYFCRSFICGDCGDQSKKFCKEYLDSEDKTETNKKMTDCIYNHNLVIIPNLKKVQESKSNINIEIGRFGINLHTDKLLKDKNHNYGFVCSLCNEKYNDTARYLCLNCRGPEIYHDFGDGGDGYVEFCESCFEKCIVTDENINLKEEIFDVENHDFDSHIYLRICFPNGSYFNY